MSNGIVNIPHGILQKPSNQPNASNAPKAAAKRTAQPRLKIIIRRLPPGLTEAEFISCLGPEWKLGGGKVDWFVYRHGKISKDLAKPSRPARAYLHLNDATHTTAFSDAVRHTQFLDAKNSTRDTALLGPPTVEFASYTRIPASRKRKDPRQGTIDQEPEFIAFLESLTNPIQRPVAELEPSQKGVKWTTTPLIEHIREKKARKEKPSSSKASKRDGRDAAKAKAAKEAPALPTPDKSKRQTKATRAAKEAVKVLTRQAATNTTTSSSANSGAEKGSPAPSNVEKAQPERRRERPVAQFNLAAKIQRDLGLNPTPRRASRGQKGGADASSTSSASNNLPEKEESSSSATASTTTPVIAANPKREPRGRDRRNSKPTKPEAAKAEGANTSKPTPQAAPLTILKKPAAQAAAAKDSASKQNQNAAANAASNTAVGNRAFLKHANQSQGITEALLKTALSVFGPIAKVDIDSRKGIAHADFATPEGLTAAIVKGKVEVGSGAVVISRYKERAPRGGNGAPAAPSGSNAGGNSTPVPAARPSEGAGSRGRGSRARGGRGRGQTSQTQSQASPAGPSSIASSPATAPASVTAPSTTPAAG
jgi:regulator of nonsense transcripts 3